MTAPWLLVFLLQTDSSTAAAGVATSTAGMTAEDLALARHLDVLEDWRLLQSLDTLEDLLVVEAAEEAP